MGPKPKAIAVAVAYPSIPTNNAGRTNLFHSFACAIAAAVVGPPTLAFEDRYNSRFGKLNMPFPIAINVPKWIAICNAEKANNEGACCKTTNIEPAAPDAAKNICINATPNAVPVSLIDEKKLGNIVAANTVKIDIIGREDVPAGNRNFVMYDPTVTNVDATDIDIASDGRVIDDDVTEEDEESDCSIFNSPIDATTSSSSSSSFPVGWAFFISAPLFFAVVVSFCVVVVDDELSPSPAVDIENRNAKYNATTTLSAATDFMINFSI